MKKGINAEQPWVVYAHYEGETPVYIGSGTVERPAEVKKRSPEHRKWLGEYLVKHKNASFMKILFVTDSFDEARYIEGRLIAEHKSKFNKNLNKATFSDINEAIAKIKSGTSIRQCARDINMVHNNLRVLLNLPHAGNSYEIEL